MKADFGGEGFLEDGPAPLKRTGGPILSLGELWGKNIKKDHKVSFRKRMGGTKRVYSTWKEEEYQWERGGDISGNQGLHRERGRSETIFQN